MRLEKARIIGCFATSMRQAQAALMSRTVAPHAILISRAVDDEPISLQIGLKLQNMDHLEDHLLAVSTPGGQGYGQYWDVDQIAKTFYPSAQTINAVKRWLDHQDVRYSAEGVSHITVTTTVKTANTLLNASFAHYSVDGVPKLRTVEYSIPDEVHQHIDLVHPTTYFGRTRRRPRLETSDTVTIPLLGRATDNCTLMTPASIRALYNIKYSPDPASGSRLGFGSFLNISSDLVDFRLYQAEFGLSGPANMSVHSINGGLEQRDPTARYKEADMDSQLINGVSHTLPITEFVTGGSPPYTPDAIVTNNNNEPYLEYYQYLLSKPNSELPQVISNSYGENERTVPEEYARRVCAYIGLMGLRGITVIECTGDWGIGAACLSNDGKNRLEFDPQFPASCPYVTAVGGTQGVSGSSSTCLDEQEAWFAGSGGFSKYFRRPQYQQNAIETFLDQHIDRETKVYYSKFANFGGRGFPDVSAHSFYPSYRIFYNGSASSDAGTSAAAPVIAGIIGLLNDARLRAGKPAMGFVNPWLYSLKSGAGLVDVTTGSAVGCSGFDPHGNPVPGGGVIPYAAWNGTQGWDPATGLGFPDFMRLLISAMAVI